MKSIKVGVLDRQHLFRDSLCHLLKQDHSYEISFSSASLSETELKLVAERIDILILDPSGFDEQLDAFLYKVRDKYPITKVIILSAEFSAEAVMGYIEIGVGAIYSKYSTSISFTHALHEIVQNKNIYDIKLGPRIRNLILEARKREAEAFKLDKDLLTKRELQILEFVCTERTNQEISETLNISVRTIESHRRNMIEKTESKTMMGVVVYALKNNLTFHGSDPAKASSRLDY
jgi:DNA-binding NarL/FixJ family response regulator